MKKVLSSFKAGDMTLVYFLDTERELVGMSIFPRDMPFDAELDAKRKIRAESLVQAKIIGDKYSGSYFGGTSMKYSQTTDKLKYDHQSAEEENGALSVRTYLKSEDGIEAVNVVSYRHGDSFASVRSELINNSGNDIRCEMLSCFSLCGISLYLDGAGEGETELYRIRSRWSAEGRLVCETPEDLQLEDNWCYGNSNSVRFGQVGSMPTKGYFPFMAARDKKNNVIWGVQMGCAASWQMEMTRADDGLCLSGGGADREFGHWVKTIKSGESFGSVSAVISVCRGGIDEICQRLTEAQERALQIPECEETLPVIFNEYCTTWGSPSEENIGEILETIRGRGIDYFVIDCGWYREKGVPWHIGMGEYKPSRELFPNGIKNTVKKINEYGMKAGIWFEFENIGPACAMFDRTEHMLKRDGLPLTTVNRRFWDMNDPWVTDYLDERVTDFLKENGFEYIKVDYNETIGIGCDNEDSLGEGLRKNMEGTVSFFKRIRERIPDIVIENCASGGNRLEPVFMSLCSMASFSDAHECAEIPIIAANLHRVILPRQSQIWCVVRESDDLKRTAYSVCAGTLGRLCISGDITKIGPDAQRLIDEGIAFYKKASPVIKKGRSFIYRDYMGDMTGDRRPRGFQAVKRENEKYILITAHTFEGKMPEYIEVKTERGAKIRAVYSHKEFETELSEGTLKIKTPESFAGYAVLLEKQ